MNREQLFDAMNILAACDKAMTEVDLIRWSWQTDLDMMSFIGQDIGVNIYVPEEPKEITMTVKRVPLVRYQDGERIVIGVADVDEESGVVRAEVHEDHAEILAIGHQAEYSIADEDPPVYDHRAIKHQLRDLVAPGLYSNPFKIQGVTAPFPKVKLDIDVEPTWGGISGEEMVEYYNNHPFFKEES